MKRIIYKGLLGMGLPVIAFFLMSSVPCFGGFKLPSKVYTVDKLEDAKKEAKERKLPLAFLYSDKNTT